MSTVTHLDIQKIPKLGPSGLIRSEHARAEWTVIPAQHHSFEDVLQPVYWTHHAASFRPGHKVCVIPPDMSYYAELIVRFVTDNSAKVGLISHTKFDTEEQADETLLPVDYRVEWVVGNRQYAVIRKSDKATLQSFKEKNDAVKWLIDNRKSLVA